ncbi:hypothetical protein PoB_001707900 [Plakobranchus ocellatus]|uniref:Uncharacterized protein n=1 Tax=Plakobranchus ocellatus TaxID=259542 RepID=A0AAV3Z840_9GAST|nr:hypothetical protein PoB_001707900 [Plakobranchus ocellatus]
MYTFSTKLGDVSGTVDTESGLRSAGTLLSPARAPPPAPWPDGGPEVLRSPCCGLATYKKKQTDKTQYLPLNIPLNTPLSV